MSTKLSKQEKIVSDELRNALGKLNKSLESQLDSFLKINKELTLGHVKLHKDFFNWVTKNSKKVNGKKFITKKNISVYYVKHEKFLRSKAILNDFRYNMFTGMVNDFDVFITRLINIVFINYPEVLDKSIRDKVEKDLDNSFKLSSYKSIKDLRNYFVNNETEYLLRKNRAEQIKWLGKYAKIDAQGLIPELIEISQRRNQIVHNDGQVSQKYLDTVKRYKYQSVTQQKVGDILVVNKAYIRHTFKVLHQAAILLTNRLWQKFLPNDQENRGSAVNAVCVEIIKVGENELALSVIQSQLAKENKYDKDEMDYFKINQLLALKNLGMDVEFNDVISKYSFKKIPRELKMGLALLNGKHDEALKIMSKIPKSRITEKNYYDWPIFNEIRNTKKFKLAFSNKFKKAYQKFLKEIGE